MSSCSSHFFQFAWSWIFFAPTVCYNFSIGLLDFQKGSLIHGWLPRSVFSRAPGSWSREPEASSWATSGSTTRTKVCLLNTQFLGGQHFSRGPWHVVLDTAASTKTRFLWMDTKLFSVRGISRGILFNYLADVTHHPQFLNSGLHWLLFPLLFFWEVATFVILWKISLSPSVFQIFTEFFYVIVF